MDHLITGRVISLNLCSVTYISLYLVMIIIMDKVSYNCLIKGWWCSGFFLGFLRHPTQEVGGSIPVSTSPREVRLGLSLCNLLRLTQPNDRETVIEG